MFKKAKVKNPIQKKVCIYSWEQNIHRSVIFEISGRSASPIYKMTKYSSNTRYILFSDLTDPSNGVRLCLKKTK